MWVVEVINRFDSVILPTYDHKMWNVASKQGILAGRRLDCLVKIWTTWVGGLAVVWSCGWQAVGYYVGVGLVYISSARWSARWPWVAGSASPVVVVGWFRTRTIPVVSVSPLLMAMSVPLWWTARRSRVRLPISIGSAGRRRSLLAQVPTYINISTTRRWLSRTTTLADLHVYLPSVQICALHLFLGLFSVFRVFVLGKAITSWLFGFTPGASRAWVRFIHDEAVFELSVGLKGSSEAIFRKPLVNVTNVETGIWI